MREYCRVRNEVEHAAGGGGRDSSEWSDSIPNRLRLVTLAALRLPLPRVRCQCRVQRQRPASPSRPFPAPRPRPLHALESRIDLQLALEPTCATMANDPSREAKPDDSATAILRPKKS